MNTNISTTSQNNDPTIETIYYTLIYGSAFIGIMIGIIGIYYSCRARKHYSKRKTQIITGEEYILVDD